MILTGVTMPTNGKFGVSIMDTEDPTNIIWLGVPGSWDATKFTLVDDVNFYVPMGEDKPIITVGPTGYYQGQGVVYWIPRLEKDGAGNWIDGDDTLYRFEMLVRKQVPVRYRDPRGVDIIAFISNFQPQVQDAFHRQVTFDIMEIEEMISPNA